jgi:hypothetical protein
MGFAVLAFLAAAAAACLYIAKRRPAALGAGIAAGLLSLPITFGYAMPRLDTLWLTPRIVAAVESVRPCPDSPLVTSTFREPSLVFAYGPYRTQLASGPENAADLLGADPACAVALIDISERDAFLARAGELGLAPRAAGQVEGTNYSNGDDQDLTVYLADGNHGP